MDSQSARWEHGSLLVLTRMVPGLVGKSIRSLDWQVMLLALDAMVPPLTSLFFAIMACVAVALLLALIDSGILLVATVSILATLVFSLGVAWYRYGRGSLHFADAVMLPIYMIRKLSVYLDFVKGRISGWTRTDRK